MIFSDVNIDFLNYISITKNIKEVKYNNRKGLELWTPVVYIKKTKDSYNNEYIQFDLDEYPKVLELIKCIDIHVMLLHNITEKTRDTFKSSLFNTLLSCRIPKKKNILQTQFFINKSPSILKDIKNNDKASCCIYIDQIYIDNTITLKWKIKKCCVYRNEK